MWHVTCDMWHNTHAMWHLTYDRWGRWTFSQNVSSLALTVWEWRFDEDIFTNHHDLLNRSINEWMNELINNKDVYRTAPATPLFRGIDHWSLLQAEVNSVQRREKTNDMSRKEAESECQLVALLEFGLRPWISGFLVQMQWRVNKYRATQGMTHCSFGGCWVKTF